MTKLRAAEAMLSAGKSVPQVVQALDANAQAFTADGISTAG